MLLKFAALTFVSLASITHAASLKLALNWKPEPQFGGFYAADINKTFLQKQLDVKILEGGSGTPTIQMLASGVVEYAVVSADEIILSHDRGATDVVAIFASYQTNPQGILVHAEQNFQSIDDVFKSSGTLLWQDGLPYAQFIKKKYGKDFKIKTAPYTGGIGNFQNDPQISQQCFVTSEPLTAQASGLKVRTFLVADSGYNPYTTVLVTTASRLKEKPAEVQAVVAAVRDGWNAYLKDPKPTNLAMGKLNKAMNADTFQKSAEAQRVLIETAEAKGVTLGSMTQARWQSLVDQLAELKLIKKKMPATALFWNL